MACASCSTAFGWLFERGQICDDALGGCGKRFCSSCLKYAVLTAREAEARGVDGRISLLCESCFQSNSSLDFSVNVEVLHPTTTTSAPSEAPPCVVLVHGAGGCRTMFLRLARQFQQHGYRAVLMDLPGHGARMNEPLTLDSAIAAIINVLDEHTVVSKGVAPLLIGGSLGGYITMELLGRHPDRVGGAIVAMCGQNVGKDRGLKASLGLWFMGFVLPYMSAPQMLRAMVSQAKTVPTSDLLELSLRPGAFFDQLTAHIEILKASDPAASLPHFAGPIWFVNGTLDHRDSEQKWLQCSQHATLTDYEGGDHFFSHDERFAARFNQGCIDFAQQKVFKIQEE